MGARAESSTRRVPGRSVSPNVTDDFTDARAHQAQRFLGHTGGCGTALGRRCSTMAAVGCDDLPPDVLRHTMTFLPAPDVVQCARVCRAFRSEAVSDATWLPRLSRDFGVDSTDDDVSRRAVNAHAPCYCPCLRCLVPPATTDPMPRAAARTRCDVRCADGSVAAGRGAVVTPQSHDGVQCATSAACERDE